MSKHSSFNAQDVALINNNKDGIHNFKDFMKELKEDGTH